MVNRPNTEAPKPWPLQIFRRMPCHPLWRRRRTQRETPDSCCWTWEHQAVHVALTYHYLLYIYIYIYACACYTCDWNFATWMDMLSKITMACFWEKYRSMGCPRIGYDYPAVYSCISCSSSSLISRQKYHVLNPFKSNNILYNIPRSYNIYIYIYVLILYICVCVKHPQITRNGWYKPSPAG